jgi:hypothetical protein
MTKRKFMILLVIPLDLSHWFFTALWPSRRVRCYTYCRAQIVEELPPTGEETPSRR